MCFRCELRDRAAEGDEDAIKMINLLKEDQMTGVWPLIVNELIQRLGETTITVDVSEVDTEHFAGLMINRADDEYTICLVQRGELDVVRDLTLDQSHTVN